MTIAILTTMSILLYVFLSCFFARTHRCINGTKKYSDNEKTLFINTGRIDIPGLPQNSIERLAVLIQLWEKVGLTQSEINERKNVYLSHSKNHQ